MLLSNVMLKSIVWMAAAQPALRDLLPSDGVLASSVREFLDAGRDAQTLSIIDTITLASLDAQVADVGADDNDLRQLLATLAQGPVIAITSSAQIDIARSWVGHVVNPELLQHALGRGLLTRIVEGSESKRPPNLIDWISPEISGRRVRIQHASKRTERIKRMTEYVIKHGGSDAVARQVGDVAEELLTNAFYNAPVAAGAVDQPIPRTQDVTLPEESSIDLAYAYHDGVAFVRVRDPFGSLSRARFASALTRPGAPTGWKRIMALASQVAISVNANQHTEVLVAIVGDAPPGVRPFGLHLFFREAARRRQWKTAELDTAITDPGMSNSFVSIVLAAGELK